MKNIFVTSLLAITMLINMGVTLVRAESHTIHFNNK
jgi:hypothetical protein